MEPGNYAEYPRPRRGEIDFAVISEAFQLIFKHPGPMLVASTIGYFIPLCIMYAVTLVTEFQMGMFSPTQSTDPAEMLSKMGQLYAMQIPLYIYMFASMSVFGYSITQMTLKSVRNQTVEWADVFSGFRYALPAMAVTFLSSVLAIFGFCALCIGAFVVWGLLMLATPILVDQKVGPIVALQKSFETMRPHLWMGALIFLVYALLSGIGAMACLVGVIVTYPIYHVVPALIYRDLTPDVEPAPY